MSCLLIDSSQTLSYTCFILDQHLFGRRSVWKYTGLFGFFFFVPRVYDRSLNNVMALWTTEWRHWTVETGSVIIMAPQFCRWLCVFEKDHILSILHGLFHQYSYLLDRYFSLLTSFMKASQWPCRGPSEPLHPPWKGLTGEIKPPSMCSWTFVLWDGDTVFSDEFNVSPACMPPLDYKPKCKVSVSLWAIQLLTYRWHLIIRTVKWETQELFHQMPPCWQHKDVKWCLPWGASML